MNVLSKTAEHLTELMIYKAINVKSLSAKIGVHPNTVYRWLRGEKYIKISYLIKLADIFNCSIDFLVGRSDKTLDFVPRECPPIYPQMREVIAKCGRTINQIHRETTIKDSYFSKWKHGQQPHILMLIELANYLDISIDYLIGREV